MGRIKAADRVGQSFGRLTVLSVVGKTNHGHAIVSCSCECGKVIDLRLGTVVRGDTRSCGCLNREVAAARCAVRCKTHGHSYSSEYDTWRGILKRCTNPKTASYPHYGGRGITVCPDWLSFENFYADMGPRPSPKHSIDRKDNNGNYCKENCRWATIKEQNNNQRRNTLLTYNGETRTLSQWAEEFGIKTNTLSMRLVKYKWSLEKALTTPSRSLRARQ